MGAMLLVLAVFAIGLGLAMFLLGVKYEQDKVARVHIPTDEAQYEISPSVVITAENVEQIVEHQIMHAMGMTDKDHPAIALRKAEAAPAVA